MPAILIVDDENDYREVLSASFTRAGYSVYTAGNADQAVALAANLQPDVLIVDWLLRHSVDGLTLGAAIKVLLPSLAVIAITGFGSKDLRSEVSIQDIFGYIEKPFGLGVVHDYVRRALVRASQSMPFVPEPIGTLITDREGAIRSYNPVFGEMIDVPDKLLRRVGIDDIIEISAAKLFKTAASSWVPVKRSPHVPNEVYLRMRTFDQWETRLFIVLEHAQQEYRSSPIVKVLLGPMGEETPIKVDTHFLLLDRKLLSRRLLIEEFRNIGLVCHAATDIEESIALLEKDKMLLVVIIDGELSADEITRGVQHFRRVRPSVVLIGTGQGDQNQFFEACGVPNFLRKPWDWPELAAVVAQLPQKSETQVNPREN